MPKYKDTDYLHISSRVKMLEAKLLGKDVFEKIIESDTSENVIRVLLDNGYDAGDKALEKPEDFEILLMAEQERVYSFLEQNVSDRTLIDLFCLPYDYQNIKAVLKAEYLGINPDRMMFSNGTIEKQTILSAVSNRDKSVLSQKMYEAVENSVEAYAKTGDPQQLDIFCDKFCFEDILNRAKKSDFDFLYVYFTKKVDLLNISAFIRLRKIKKDYKFFEKVFIPCENGIKLKFYEDLYDQPIAAFIDALANTIYSSMAEKINPANVDIEAIEEAIEDYSISMIQSFRYVPFGPQVPLSFLLAKDEEIKNLRVAISAKLAGLSGERIRERLRLGYV
ncbi:MAG: hypothetical protein DBX47_05045 [Clostridiales bacterium]|nr:MAG: hypothetical protein DBX47_05045 [Clostridiales bacterium]